MRLLGFFLLPCPADLLAGRVKAMFGELRQFFATDADLEIAARPFVEALSGFPADCAMDAIRQAKDRFGSKVQAVDAKRLAETISADRYAVKAALEFGASDEKPNKTVDHSWKPLSQADYAALSLSEKHRHCQILATHYRGLAGPMSIKTGLPVRQDRWDEYTPLAEAAEEEAKRLGEQVHEYRTRDAKKAADGGPKRVHYDLHFMKGQSA